MEITEDQLVEIKEQAWLEGERAALVRQLSEAIKHLYYGEEYTMERLVVEREGAIAALRIICSQHPEYNDWEPSLHLADIIGKYVSPMIESIQE